MWMHLPSQCFPSVQGSEDWSWELGSFSQTLARFASSRGTFRQPKHWRDAWTTGRLMPLRFGPTLPDSMVSDGLERWISSWAEFRANRSAWPASARGRQTSGGYGPTSGAGFGMYNRDSSSWRTFPDLFGMDYPLSLETWPKRGSLRNGAVSARRMWERPTVESGSLSWPTPVSNDAKKSEIDQHRSLTSSVQAWPTPTTNDAKNDNSPSQAERNTPPLNVAAANWQTPATDSFRSRGGERKDEMGLDQQARSFRRDQQTGRGGQRTPSGVVLNPRFVEALMGLPDGWTDSGPVAMTAYMRWEMLSSLSVRRWLSPRSTKVYWGVGPGKEKASA